MSIGKSISKSFTTFADAIFHDDGFNVLMDAQLRKTKNRYRINRAVHNKRNQYKQYTISQNDNLNEEQCRYLYEMLSKKEEYGYRGNLVSRPNFPSDILLEIALKETYNWILETVSNHPNASPETRVIAALRKDI